MARRGRCPSASTRSGRRVLSRDVLAERAVHSFGIREELVQVRIDQDDVRAFAAPARGLASDARSDQLGRVFVSKRVLILAHRFFVVAASSDVPRGASSLLGSQTRIILRAIWGTAVTKSASTKYALRFFDASFHKPNDS